MEKIFDFLYILLFQTLRIIILFNFKLDRSNDGKIYMMKSCDWILLYRTIFLDKFSFKSFWSNDQYYEDISQSFRNTTIACIAFTKDARWLIYFIKQFCIPVIYIYILLFQVLRIVTSFNFKLDRSNDDKIHIMKWFDCILLDDFPGWNFDSDLFGPKINVEDVSQSFQDTTMYCIHKRRALAHCAYIPSSSFVSLYIFIYCYFKFYVSLFHSNSIEVITIKFIWWNHSIIYSLTIFLDEILIQIYLV